VLSQSVFVTLAVVSCALIVLFGKSRKGVAFGGAFGIAFPITLLICGDDFSTMRGRMLALLLFSLVGSASYVAIERSMAKLGARAKDGR
jgi:hypothetical protein